MGNRVFLVFANDEDNPLGTLREEDEKLYELFAERERQKHLAIFRDSSVRTETLGHYLEFFRDEIILFHYSGHAGSDQLRLADFNAHIETINEYLAQCPNLRLVVLNGCSTAGEVEQLVNLKSKPAVVFTSAPVGDREATVFSKTFYKYLCSQSATVEEAFDQAIRQVRLAHNHISVVRSLDLLYAEAEKGNTTPWGLLPGNSSVLHWRLPNRSGYTEANASFQSNSILIPKLLQAFSDYYPKAREVLRKGKAASRSDTAEAVLEPLPLPLSEQLRVLMARPQQGSENTFFIDQNPDRIKQIAIAYRTLMELAVFIFLAECWDLYLARQNAARALSNGFAEPLKAFFRAGVEERDEFDMPALAESLRELLRRNQAVLFCKEMESLPRFDQPDTDFGASVGYLNQWTDRKIRSLSDEEWPSVCQQAEKALADFYAGFNFLAHYKLRSVRDIETHHYRHQAKTRYSHKVVKLIQKFHHELDDVTEERQAPMYTFSVCLYREDTDGYLNLSPFVIDQNAFSEDKTLAKLHHFMFYDRYLDSFTFRHVYKRHDAPLNTARDRETYQVIQEQFDAFAHLVFKKNIKDL